MRAATGLTIGVLCGVQFVDVLGVGTALSALPAMLDGVAAPPGSAPILATAYAALFGGLLIFGAQLGDRFGHRRVLVAGTVAFALVGLVGATAGSAVQLIVARGLQGASAAVSVPCALTLLLAAADDPRRRGAALAAWSASGAAAGATGLLVGGVMTESLGWRSVLWMNVPIGILLAVAIQFLIRKEDPGATAGRLDPVASLLLVATVLLVIIAASMAEDPHNWVPAGTLLLVACVVGAAFVWQQRRARDPLFPPAAFASANLRSGSLISFVNTAATSSAMVLATLHLQQELGVPAGAAGLTLVPFSLSVVAGAALTKPIGRRLAAPRLGALGLAGIAIGIGVIALTNGAPPGVLAGGAVAGIGLGLASVAGNDLGTGVGDDLRSLATGIINTAAQLGTALGVAILLVLATLLGPALQGTRIAWAVSAAAALATSVGLARVRPRKEAGSRS